MADAKKVLQSIELLDAQIENKLEELQRLWALVTKVTAAFNAVHVSSSPPGDMMGDAIARIVDLKAEINRDIDIFVEKKRKIRAAINQIENPDFVNVLYKRYFERKHWEEIACDMNMSHRNVCYIHGKALAEFLRCWEGLQWLEKSSEDNPGGNGRRKSGSMGATSA